MGEKILAVGERGPPGGGAGPPAAEEVGEVVVEYDHYYSDSMPDYDYVEAIFSE